MKKFYVIGGEFSSLNFHTFIDGTAIVRGPYETRADAEEEWKHLSEAYRSLASCRFVIVESDEK